MHSQRYTLHDEQTTDISERISARVRASIQEKLTPLLQLKYHGSISDAVADLGRRDEIGRVFAGFQKYLYQQRSRT